MLDYAALASLEEEVKAFFNDNIEAILSRLNREDRIDDFLSIIGASFLLKDTSFKPIKNGKILVMGESKIKEDEIKGIAKSFNIDFKRFELHLRYDDAKTFNFEKLKYTESYSLILAGPMPHSGESKVSYSSVLTRIEKEEGFPPVIRLGLNELKITKTGIKEALSNALEAGLIVA